MTVAINRTTALTAANIKTQAVTITKGQFKLGISGTFSATVTILRKSRLINLKMGNSLIHTGAAAAAALTAAGMTGVVADELIGMWILNEDTLGAGLITDNTASVVTATLAGGSDTKWDVGEVGSVWEVVGEYTAPAQYIGEEVEDNADYLAIASAWTSGTARVTISR